MSQWEMLRDTKQQALMYAVILAGVAIVGALVEVWHPMPVPALVIPALLSAHCFTICYLVQLPIRLQAQLDMIRAARGEQPV